MIDINCSACSDLESISPEFCAYGVTENVCTSLENNTGLNPENDRTNCEDYEAMNDCLVGSLDPEVESFPNCDWKSFMHRLIPNLHQYLKALNCGLCGVWNKVKCTYDSIVKLIAALDDSVGAEAFVRYYRDNSGTGTGYEWAATQGAQYNLDIYMDADLDNAGSQPADRDYAVIISNCFNFHNCKRLEVTQTDYSSGDSRPIATIRKRQGMHPSVDIGSYSAPDWSWNLTTTVLVRKGEHIKINAYVENVNPGTNPDFRLHQFVLTWIPIAPVGGFNPEDILQC